MDNKLNNIKTKTNVLNEELLNLVKSYYKTKAFFAYTEHPGRYGYKLEKDDPILNFLNLDLKLEILKNFNEHDNFDGIEISDVILCKDNEGFELPVHTDDIYKYISCVLYLADNIEGTSFLLGIGVRKEITAEVNKLLYFKTKNLYHNVKKSYNIRYTIQFHYKTNLKKYINLIGFDNKKILKFMNNSKQNLLNEEILDKTIINLLDRRFLINIVNDKKYFMSKELSIHISIYPELKSNEDYKKCFFSFEENFIGLSKNFLYDANNNASYTHLIRNKYVMISRGSWNHEYKIYLPIEKDSFKKFYDNEEKVLKSWWSENYKITHDNNAIVIFVQNYSEYEYWFGWENDDFNIWLFREQEFVEKILKSTMKKIFIKFHPKMETKYIEEYKLTMSKYKINYFPQKERLDYIFNNVDSCVINSGSTAIMSMIYGIPTFYIDDTYSSIPVHKLTCKNIELIDNISEKDLPNRIENLDFIFSQILSVKELQNKSINELFKFK